MYAIHSSMGLFLLGDSRQHGGSQGLSFLRTHPLDEQRIQNLKAELPKAQAEYQKAKAAGK